MSFKNRLSNVVALAGMILSLALLAGVSDAQATTTFRGVISVDTTWTAANSPYELTGDVQVNPNVTLTVEPGVVVNFAETTAGPSYGASGISGSEIFVKGSLIADGTDANPISITHSRGDGTRHGNGGIELSSGTGPTLFDHVTFGPGGSNFASIFALSTPLTISNSKVLNTYGVVSSTASGGANVIDTTVSDSWFDQSGLGFPKYTNGTTGTISITGNSFTRGDSALHIQVGGTESVTVADNVIAHNQARGLTFWTEPGSGVNATIQDNTFLGNGTNIFSKLGPGSTGTFNASGNSIVGASVWNWDMGQAYGGPTADTVAENNWWGTTVQSEIAAKVHDNVPIEDDPTPPGVLDFTPFLTSPNGIAPAVDLTAPPVQIDSGPTGTVASDAADFSFSSSEAGTLFECQFDSAGWNYCNSPQHLAGLTGPSHKFEVRALDASGNLSNPVATRTWNLTGPPVQIDSGPSGTVASDSADFAFSSSQGPKPFQCQVDSGGWNTCTSPLHLTGLVGSAHKFEVRALDGSGNVSSPIATRNWNLTGPPAQIDSGPSGNVATSDADFAFSSSQGPKPFECQVDSGGWHTCVSPQHLSELINGAHKFEARALDGSGNVSNPVATRSWNVSVPLPPVGIDSGPSGTVETSDADFAFSSTQAGTTFQCHVDSQPWVACTSPRHLSGLPDGVHTFETRAVDIPGNVSDPVATRSWRVNANDDPPTARLSINPNLTLTGTAVNFDAAQSSPAIDSPISKYEWDLDGDGVFELDTGAVSHTTSTFDHQVSINPAVRVTTDLGTSNTTSSTLDVRLTPPSGPQGVSINNGAQFTNDPDVAVSAVWPTLMSKIFASNDGGFGKARTFDVSPTFDWHLDSSGPERLPKTIYVRFAFDGSSPPNGQTYQDDIILDETPPVVSSASIEGSGTPAMASLFAFASAKSRSKIKMKASDKTSGVAFVQTAVNQKHPSKKRKYAKVFTVSGPKPKFIRAQDKAGNYSKWKKLKKGR